MQAFISILYVQTNSISTEKIAVGLIAFANNEVVFDVSNNKLKLIQGLSSKDVYEQAIFGINLIKNEVDFNSKNQFTNKLKLKLSAFSKDYFIYLNKYSKGVLQFSDPKPYSGEVNQYSFKKIFEKFIAEWDTHKFDNTKIKHNIQFQTSIKKKLKNPAFQEKADVDYKLDPKNINGLLAPQDIALITVNGSILGAQAIDFTTNVETIVKNVYEYEIMIYCLNKIKLKNKKSTGNSFILLFNKPASKSNQEKVLNDIVKTKNNIFTLQDENYIETLEGKLENGDYKKFSSFFDSPRVAI